MIALLVLREKMKLFYSKFDVYVTALVHFLLGFTTFFWISRTVGFMTKLNNMVVLLVLALICSFLPYGVITIIAGALLLVHVASVSLELALLLVICMLIVAILYYGFQPGDSYLLLLTPIFCYLKIPYAIPLLVGLSGRMVSAVPVGCGTFLYYVIQYVKQNAGVLTNDASDITERFVQIMKSIMSNHVMVVMAASAMVGVVIVYLIRRLSVDYAWMIAIVVGAIAQLAVIFVGEFVLDVSISMGQLLGGIVVSMLIAAVYNFMIFTVDYTRTEYTQFEDDDYYYYVKAVPKMSIAAPDVKVQKISSTRIKRSGREETAEK